MPCALPVRRGGVKVGIVGEAISLMSLSVICVHQMTGVFMWAKVLGIYTPGGWTHQKVHPESWRIFPVKTPDGETPGHRSQYNDCLTRQVTEGVFIRRCGTTLMNTKSEWHQPPIWKVQSEILRGWKWYRVWVWQNELPGGMQVIYSYLKQEENKPNYYEVFLIMWIEYCWNKLD